MKNKYSTKAKSDKHRAKVKAVKIVKVETVAPEEHIITSETHVIAPLEELPHPFAATPEPIEFVPDEVMEHVDEHRSWAAWWKSLWS